MSGYPRMNEFTDPYKPNRDHIERLLKQVALNNQIKELSDHDLAIELHRIGQMYPETLIVCLEAAERIAGDGTNQINN